MKTGTRLVSIAFCLGVGWTLVAGAQDYRPADSGQRPETDETIILPEKFLRGYDPVTVYYQDNRGPGRGPADDGRRRLKIEPDWPGGWFWLDRKTLQFRPAEPWPALARFAARSGDASRVLTTMMSAPSAMSPADGSDNLRPFRTFTLTFPQALSIGNLRKMIELQVRELPGLESSGRRNLRDWNIAQLPRGSLRDQAVYAITLDQEVPEGRQLVVNLSLALGEEGKVLWTGRLATRLPFHLESIACGGSQQSLRGNAKLPEEMALACGHHGDTPQLVFSAEVAELTLTQLKKLVRLQPAVENLHFQIYGRRVALRGKFAPEVLYRMRLQQAPVKDRDGRRLQDPGELETFFYLGRKQPFIRWQQASAILEARGPRMIPLRGYGEPRADVRIYRIDPQHPGLWPFPASPVVVNEESSPPFPGEEPQRPKAEEDIEYVSSPELTRHLRLLGSPLISRVVDLPLASRGATTRFGLDIGRLLDERVGRERPGHYLVGLRRLTGPPQRAYVRVQLTNLSLTTVEERDQVVFYVRTLDEARPVRGARVVIEAVDEPPKPRPGQSRQPPRIDRVVLTTDARGRAVMTQHKNWRRLHRIQVRKGEDRLVLDPRDPPPCFANNHWSPWGQWLHWITADKIPDPKNDKLIGFVFTERPIYRPGEKVYLKGYLRNRSGGKLGDPGPAKDFRLIVKGPGGKEWARPVEFTALRGFATEFQEKDIPTGTYRVELSRIKPRQVIATRTFKIEAYRIPTFEVQLSSPEKVPNDGPFEVKAAARYYAGGSVASQPIAWRVTRHAYHHVPKGREGYLFASSTQFSRRGRVRPPESRREERELDEKGADGIEINPALDMDGSARIYTIEATVTGVDNQLVTAVAHTKALPPFVLGMKLKRYAEKPMTLQPRILAVGVDDKLRAGQKVSVRLYRRTWHSHLRETDFATGKASYVTEQQDTKLLEREVVTGKKPVRPELPIEQAGVYVVELVARDKLGRVQTLSADLYVGGKEALAWKKSSQGVFELTTDKEKYKPGEQANLIIKSPFQTGEALLIIEEPGKNRYQFEPVRGGKAVVRVPIRARHVPNLPVHVVLMRGRLGESAEADERYRPRTLAASRDIQVEPTSNQVQVGIEHPGTVRPGTTAKVTITLRDDKKRPVAGEVTLWLVDEAVLALADEAPLDPLKSFVVHNQRTTSVRDTRNEVIGRIAEEEEPAGDGGEGDEKDRLKGKRRVRKNFQTVPYYQATLEVGRSGRITVPVKMSDDLTNFKVRVVAASGMERFGFAQNRLRVRLPLLVQPQLPRFVRQGDSFWAGGVGRLLEGPGGAGAVAVEVKGMAAARRFSKRVQLARNRAESHLFPLEARSTDPTRPTELTVRMDIVRNKDGVGDAFEVKLPLLPDRTVEHVAWFGKLKEGDNQLQPFPEKPRAGTALQEVVVTAVPGVLELLAALDYVASYPHGCLEQRMSRLMPQMATGALLQKLGLNRHYALQVGGHVKRLLAELGLFQDDEGFFSFWPGSEGSVYLTAQAVRFMHMAQKLGIGIDSRSWGRAVAALKRALRSDFRGLHDRYRYNQQTSAIRALTWVGELDEHYLIDLFQHRSDMDLTSIADLSIAMSGHPGLFRTNMEALTRDLWDAVIFKLHRGEPHYKGLRWRRRGWYSDYLGSRPATLAAVFESLVVLDPKNDKLTLLRDALLSFSHATRGFGSTHASRRAIEALVTYLALARHEGVDARVALSEGGTLELSDRTKVARSEIRSDRVQTAALDGAESVGAHVRYTYLPAAPGDRVEARGQGFVVDRSATLIPADGSAHTHFDEECGKKVAVALGDILELHTSLLAKKDHFHVALVVPFAAGFEPLNPELKTAGPEARPSRRDSLTPTYVQRLDHEVRYYFTRLPKGSHGFHFRVRATCEGSYVHPAPWAEQMYHQEVRGRGVGMRVVITGEHQKTP